MLLVRICIGVSLVRISMKSGTLVRMGLRVWRVFLTSVMGQNASSLNKSKKGTLVQMLANMVLTSVVP